MKAVTCNCRRVGLADESQGIEVCSEHWELGQRIGFYRAVETTPRLWDLALGICRSRLMGATIG